MKRQSMGRRVVAIASAVLASTAGAAGNWNESVDGDLSGDQAVPTVLTLAEGSNLVTGTTGLTANGTDRDFATLVVPAGMALAKIVVQPGTQPAGGVSFIGLGAGTVLPTDALSPDPTKLLGWLHYGTGWIGLDILPELGATFGSIGFSGPLPAGSYALWIQDTGFEVATYGFRFEVASIPEPGTWAMLGAGLGLLGLLGARRR